MPRHYLPKLLFFVAAIAAVSGLGCSRDTHDHPDLITGEQLFNHHCAECHGEDGTGKLFESLPANILTQMNPSAIINYIRMSSTQDREMPVFPTMPVPEARLITEHLIQLQTDYENGFRNKPKPFLIDP